MKKFFVLFLILSIKIFAQVDVMSPGKPAQKDPFFAPKTATPKPAEKVNLIHADNIRKDSVKYDGNPYFEGNVRFEHQGSTLDADIVIWYKEQNFLRAIGNVKLQNADGSVITAEEMEYDGNTQRGVARKNVVLTDPQQTIKTETLYYDRLTNKAYFNTGGTITNAQNTMYTRAATYDLQSRMIDFSGNVKIDNAQYTVEGSNIIQNQNTNTATFSGPTTITNKQNPANKVFTENGIYNMNTKEVWLNKNSVIYYNGKKLTGDKMYYNQISGFGKANGNVTLTDPKENRYIKGGYGEIYELKDSAVMTQKPYVVKILQKDTIYFSAEKIISYRKPDAKNPQKKLSFIRAFYKSRFYKSNIQARADSLSFNETDGILHLVRNPIAWSGGKQITGDKIDAYFDTENEYIDSLKVTGNAFAISKVDSLNLKDEFHQVKGKVMTAYYQKNEINLAKVIGNAQAINYADDENPKMHEINRIGIALSTCGTIEAIFELRKMQILSCNVGAHSDIYPMSLISHDQRFLPGFNWNTKDRLQRWQDIFLDSPNYPETVYESSDELYNAAQKKIDDAKAKEDAKKPKRNKK